MVAGLDAGVFPGVAGFAAGVPGAGVLGAGAAGVGVTGAGALGWVC